MADQVHTNRPTSAPSTVSVSAAAAANTGGIQDFARYVRDNHPGHDVQHMGFARVAPGVLGTSGGYKARQGVVDIWFCGTDGTLLYDLA